jgi:uncharacterized protein YecE (DUF72 family)
MAAGALGAGAEGGRAITTAAEVRVGIAGWRYPPWRGDFYPAGLPQRAELEYAASRLRTIEINGSFYSAQPPAHWRSWAAAVPDDFDFAVKGARFITHMKRLRDIRIPLANYFATSPVLLGDRLGPILWQLPPNFRYDRALLDDFLTLLPHTERAAAALAREHDGRLAAKGGAWTRARPGAGNRPVRHAIEVRNPTFDCDDFADLCARHRVAIVVADGRAEWPLIERITADHVYLRLHGHGEVYVAGYSDAQLEDWAARIRGWAAAPGIVAVHCYFDNDVKVRAPYDAMNLASRLGVGVGVGVGVASAVSRR